MIELIDKLNKWNIFRWNYSDFSPCNSPCGIGIQTRDVTCIHEVARGPGNTVVVPNHMCQTPPPVDRQHCNVWDCPPKWQPGEWDKVKAAATYNTVYIPHH